jgi:hypothetical protein
MIGKDALEFLSKQAVDARPICVSHQSEPGDVYFRRELDGSYSRQESEPKPRRYTAARLEDFTELVKEMRDAPRSAMAEKLVNDHANGVATPLPRVEYTLGPTLVLVGEKQIVALLNEHHRRERLHFELTKSKAFKTLTECEESRDAAAQKEFLSMLRIDLNGAVEATVINLFKQIKFEKSSEGESSISNSSKAVSNKVKMSLAAGGQEIPDEITAKLAVYEEFPEIVLPVRCAVETNIEEATFTLIPLAGELNEASVETQAAIEVRITNGLMELAEAGDLLVHCGEVNC